MNDQKNQQLQHQHQQRRARLAHHVAPRRHSNTCRSAHGLVQLLLLLFILVVIILLMSVSWHQTQLTVKTLDMNHFRMPSTTTVSHHSAVHASLHDFGRERSPPPPQLQPLQLATETSWYDARGLLPQEPTCASAYQDVPWQKDMNGLARPTTVQINATCPGAAQRLGPALVQQSSTSKSAKIILALFYYQDMALLSRQVHAWTQWPTSVRQQYEFVIFDDGSQVGLRARDFVQHHLTKLKDIAIDLTIYEVEQDLPFNMGGVRNLAHVVATTDHVLATDTDVYINGTVAAYLLNVLNESLTLNESSNSNLNNNPHWRIWKFLWQKMPDGVQMAPHPAVMLSHKQAYWAVGGCDEDLVGQYGQTDILLLWKADRDPAVTVTSLTDDMRDRQLYVQKWWRPEKKKCHEEWPCPPNMPKALRPLVKRVLKRNMDIFQAKRQKRANFSTSFLRFGWHVVDLESEGEPESF